MCPASINHILFNTGQDEQISTKNLSISPFDRIALQLMIDQAKSFEGVDVADNVILKISADTYKYVATFAYGTYSANEIFLISSGARTKDAMNSLWNQLCNSYAPRYHVSTPLKRKPAGPLVVDILLPCSRPEALVYLHSSMCYNLCLRLGWALLYPECIKV